MFWITNVRGGIEQSRPNGKITESIIMWFKVTWLLPHLASHHAGQLVTLSHTTSCSTSFSALRLLRIVAHTMPYTQPHPIPSSYTIPVHLALHHPLHPDLNHAPTPSLTACPYTQPYNMPLPPALHLVPWTMPCAILDAQPHILPHTMSHPALCCKSHPALRCTTHRVP